MKIKWTATYKETLCKNKTVSLSSSSKTLTMFKLQILTKVHMFKRNIKMKHIPKRKLNLTHIQNRYYLWMDLKSYSLCLKEILLTNMEISYKIHIIIKEIWNLVVKGFPNILDKILLLCKIALNLFIVCTSLFYFNLFI